MTTFNAWYIQLFSLPNPLMKYMLDNVNGNILKKLHKCCKHFYVKMPHAIFDFLGIIKDFEKREIYQYFADIPLNDPLFNSSQKNLWLMNTLYIADLGSNKNLSQFFSKIVTCDLSELILNCNVTIDQLKFLTKSGNVKCLVLNNKYQSKKNQIPPEDVFSLVPKASKICIYQFTMTTNTMEKLLKHEHQVKLEMLCWHQIDQAIDTNIICSFLEKNLDKKAFVTICFENEDLNAIFAVEICEIIRLWKPKKRIPINFPHLHMERPPPLSKLEIFQNFLWKVVCFGQ